MESVSAKASWFIVISFPSGGCCQWTGVRFTWSEEVEVNIGGLSIKHTALVGKGLTQECLLSWCRLPVKTWMCGRLKQTLLAGGRAVNFCSQHDYGQRVPVRHVTFSDTTVILANCQKQLPATTSGGGNLVGDTMLEPEATFTE